MGSGSTAVTSVPPGPEDTSHDPPSSSARSRIEDSPTPSSGSLEPLPTVGDRQPDLVPAAGRPQAGQAHPRVGRDVGDRLLPDPVRRHLDRGGHVLQVRLA